MEEKAIYPKNNANKIPAKPVPESFQLQTLVTQLN